MSSSIPITITILSILLIVIYVLYRKRNLFGNSHNKGHGGGGGGGKRSTGGDGKYEPLSRSDFEDMISGAFSDEDDEDFDVDFNGGFDMEEGGNGIGGGGLELRKMGNTTSNGGSTKKSENTVKTKLDFTDIRVNESPMPKVSSGSHTPDRLRGPSGGEGSVTSRVSPKNSSGGGGSTWD